MFKSSWNRRVMRKLSIHPKSVHMHPPQPSSVTSAELAYQEGSETTKHISVALPDFLK
uniref:Uncharacterized protein n=1 Tax=Anguilla anguilla TaxID=7936 RepID=A0A0E9W5Y6_ANGAN